MLVELAYGTFEMLEADSVTPQTIGDRFWDLELKPTLDRVQPGQHVVDVGAHIGLYSGYWASRGCIVTAVECHPVYEPILCANMARNGWGAAVLVLPTFLYSRRVMLVEALDSETRASNTWLPAPDHVLDVAARFALPLDDLMLSTVHFLKVDAQGADLHVLLGAEKTITRDRPTILIEYEAELTLRHGHTAADYHQWAIAHGYREESINGWNCVLVPE